MWWRAAAKEIPAKKISTGRRPPIDLAHLEKETRGNRELQKEVLKVFLHQSSDCVAKIKAAETISDRREAAHVLIGSARGIGALSVAYVASEIELARGPVTGRLKALDRATDAARFFIADFLAD